ncbi:hypothetical protein QFZ77_007083 [Paenibacillus sp. V4I3]|uniref:hypothetical protein n=1 Tax=Paenibacillus sp. V4I3 TaxID=3042305 RepID=UPI002780A377|nr:hypothetical protein [Paenibacillus sp. V4I3]MDQ0878424.1 hypothetical protein [Paenibacillus sp. V4I3]
MKYKVWEEFFRWCMIVGRNVNKRTADTVKARMKLYEAIKKAEADKEYLARMNGAEPQKPPPNKDSFF